MMLEMFTPQMIMLTFMAICVGQEAQGESGRFNATVLKIDQSSKFGSVEFGMKLSDKFKEITDSTVIERRLNMLDEKLKWYRYRDEPSFVDGLSVNRVDYAFKEGVLVEIAIEFSKGEAIGGGKKALAFLEKIYSGQRYDGETWLWTGQSVGLNFTGFCSLDTSSLHRLYIFPKSRAFVLPIKQEKQEL